LGLRVLLVTAEYPPDIGGIGSHVAELAKGLAPRIERVTVIHPQGPAAPSRLIEDGGIAVMRPTVIKGEPFYQLMLGGWLRRKIRQSPVDLVHVHGMRPLGATRRLPVPVIFTNHSSGFLNRLSASQRRRSRTARLLEHLAAVIGPSDELVAAVRALGYMGPAAMIPNGVDPERFRPGRSSERARLGIGEDEVVILLARRLVEKNGVVWFARALSSLRGRNVRVVIAGEGDERPQMEQILAESGLDARTVFLGPVPNAAMPALFCSADMSVLPSLAEATSIAGLEAMASGLPLVGTRVGGIPALIEDEVTGLLVPPRDPGALGAALLRLVSEPALRRAMGTAARAKIEREFTWAQVVARTMDVYQATLAAASP